jgi:uncharacterized protein YraI
MKIKHLAAGAVALAIAAASGLVQAQPQSAVTARTTNLRAGPATDYPVIAVLPAGFALAVQGCLPEYTWCDVIAGQSRGWMSAGNINYYYQNSYVPLNNYGAAIGIGLLGFVLGDYWSDNYRDRPFYRDRRRWEGRHHFAEPPRFVPQRPGLMDRGGERHFDVPSPRKRDYITRPGEVRPRVEQPPPSAPRSRRDRETQSDLNQGGSTGVDPRLQPHY